MSDELLGRQLLDLQGGDPFAWVAEAAGEHRAEHGPGCGLHPAGPLVMALVGAFVRAAQPRRLLDLGCGFGYSSLWLAAHAPAEATVDAVDRFTEHVARARQCAARAGLDGRIRFHAAEAHAFLAAGRDAYDLVHDDAWFAREPPYLAALLRRLRPGGVLTMANWFLLVDALADEHDWSAFGGPSWREDTLAYARRLAAHPELEMRWVADPPLGVATKR